MASLPGMNGDVFFGDVERPLPDWREDLPEGDDEDDELTPEERAAVVGMIGFDPAETTRADPTVKHLGTIGKKGRWVTIPANGEGGGGTPVYINDEGKITKGPDKLEGKSPDELNDGKPLAPKVENMIGKKDPKTLKNRDSSFGRHHAELIELGIAQAREANALRKRAGQPPVEFDLVEMALDDVTPSQEGEDYDNASSRHLATKITDWMGTGRKEDYAPVAVDENGKIIDGNHRHAARKIAGVSTIPVLVPKEDAR